MELATVELSGADVGLEAELLHRKPGVDADSRGCFLLVRRPEEVRDTSAVATSALDEPHEVIIGVMTTTLETELRDLRRIAGIPAIAGVNVSASGIQALAHDGLRRVDRPDAIKAADRFHIGSNTKALTALVAASAVERGAISWNTTAAEVLRSGAPSLHQLLAHRSGLLPYREDDEIRAVEVPTARRPSSGLPSRAKYWPRSRCSRPIRGTCIRMPGLS